jgi:hypothetical protein
MELRTTNPDLLTFMFGKMNSDTRRTLEELINTVNVHQEHEIIRLFHAAVVIPASLTVAEYARIIESHAACAFCGSFF